MRHSSTILIVDDAAISRKTLGSLLQSDAYRLEYAANGETALEMASALTPDLILLDVMMPGMDGFEVCRRLRADPRLAEVPVMMITALDDPESRLQGIEAGADDFIAKPFDSTELRARVRTVTRLNRYRRLLAERKRFDWVVETADDGYLMISDDHIIFYANPQARRYLGLPLDEAGALAGAFPAVAASQYRFEPREEWERWPEPPSRAGRYLVRPESSTTHELWLQVDLLDLPVGADSGQLVRLRDVTAKLVLQRDAWKFHSVIFHKLRTPLAGIKGAIDLLATRAGKLSTEQTTSIINNSRAMIERLHSDIEDILLYLSTPNLVRSGAGFRIGQLPALAHQLCDNLEIAHLAVTGIDEREQTRLSISPRAMELVLGELLENAKKFHPLRDPSVEIVVSQPAPQQLAIAVRDNGMTLGPDQLSRAATPYYQGEKYQTGEMKGMGLGLAMVSAMIYGIGGEIRIYNRELGPGVVVELTLPCTPSR